MNIPDMVEEAAHLLRYAVESGREISPTVRDPILQAIAVVEANRPLTLPEQGAFMDAYSRLALLMAPVTAATLRASDKRFGREGWWSKILPIGPLADADNRSITFGAIAFVFLLLIVVGELARTFIAVVIERQESLEKVKVEIRSVELAHKALERERAVFEASGTVRDRGRDILEEGLRKRQDELADRQEVLNERRDDLEDKIKGGFDTLYRALGFPRIMGLRIEKDDLRNAIRPIATTVGGFLLPLLYGALGTCVYILRTIYAQMVDRSFDASRVGPFFVRIFLGTLSGVTLQWIFVGEGKQIPGGITPAVLAFLGGYSVELLFTALERLLEGAKQTFKPAPASGKGAPTGGAEGK